MKIGRQHARAREESRWDRIMRLNQAGELFIRPTREITSNQSMRLNKEIPLTPTTGNIPSSRELILLLKWQLKNINNQKTIMKRYQTIESEVNGLHMMERINAVYYAPIAQERIAQINEDRKRLGMTRAHAQTERDVLFSAVNTFLVQRAKECKPIFDKITAKLPRELRDQIYEILIEDVDEVNIEQIVRGKPSSGGNRARIPSHVFDAANVGRIGQREIIQTFYRRVTFGTRMRDPLLEFLAHDAWGIGLIPTEIVERVTLYFDHKDYTGTQDVHRLRETLELLQLLSSHAKILVQIKWEPVSQAHQYGLSGPRSYAFKGLGRLYQGLQVLVQRGNCVQLASSRQAGMMLLAPGTSVRQFLMWVTGVRDEVTVGRGS